MARYATIVKPPAAPVAPRPTRGDAAGGDEAGAPRTGTDGSEGDVEQGQSSEANGQPSGHQRGADATPDAGVRRPRFVAIAGTIGAGKSTLTSFLVSRYGVQPFYEPNDSNPYLSDFYADMGRYAFHSQMYFLSAKFRAHLELARLLDANPATVYVQDRTIYEDAEIFAASLHASGVMSTRDFATYSSMYDAIRDTLPRPDLLIYLRCGVRGARRRIKVRGRPDEQDLDAAYLRRLHTAYEGWFERYTLGPKLVIETEKLDYLRNLVDRLDLIEQLEALLKAPPRRQRGRR